MYKEPEYAQTRIGQTVVRLLDGTPVLVDRVRDSGVCVVYRTPDGGLSEEVSLDDLNPLAPPLGFVNYRGSALYIARKPLRRDWRQGIRPSQVVVMFGSPNHKNVVSIIECIKGVFPTYSTALKDIQQGRNTSIAIDRKFCLCSDRLGGDITLMYKWNKVGIIKEGKVVLNKEWSFILNIVEKFYD